MRIISILIIIHIACTFAYSQQVYPFRMSIQESSNWNPKIDSIKENEFEERKIEIYKENRINSDSLLRALAAKYNDKIVITDSCCILKAIDKEIKICNRRPKDEKSWTGYRTYGYNNDFLIIEEVGYEIMSYTSFNPITGKYFHTAHQPRFIDNSLIYSAGSYYTEGEFQIMNLKEGKYFSFTTFYWDLSGFYKKDNSIFLKFSYQQKKKYLRITYK